MDKNAVPTESVGMVVILLFLLIGLIVMGCMLYSNWVHRRQRFASAALDLENEKTKTIYEKNNRGSYNRSSNSIAPH